MNSVVGLDEFVPDLRGLAADTAERTAAILVTAFVVHRPVPLLGTLPCKVEPIVEISEPLSNLTLCPISESPCKASEADCDLRSINNNALDRSLINHAGSQGI